MAITSQLSEYLAKELTQFINGLEHYNAKRIPERRRDTRDYAFLHDFYTRFLIDRNNRAHEVMSATYVALAKRASEQFPLPTYLVLCMDGRVLPVLFSGSAADIGDSLRVPGGNLSEFVRGEDGKFMLLHDSNFAKLLHSAFVREQTMYLTEVFDSHVGCAYVKGEEGARGRVTADGGLLRDVIHKKEMAEATVAFVREHYGVKKKILVIQTSFDPQTGYLFMGLETDQALEFAKQQARTEEKAATHGHAYGDYTEEVLAKLVKQGKIISAQHLAQEKKLVTIFAQHAFTPDWITRYVATTRQFWDGIMAMKELLLPVIEEQLRKVYPQVVNIELTERAMILLTNAFSGYLHNQHTYPYTKHQEELVAIAEAGFTPHTISSFVVLGRDERNLPANTLLAAALVRANRREERVKDRSGIFRNAGSFAQGPVPVVLQEIVYEQLTDEEWQFLEHIDWSDMPRDWDRMSDVDFLLYLQPKGRIPVGVSMSINNLRKRLAILFDPESAIAQHLIAHHLVALPTIVDKYRKTHCILPFVKHGYQ